MTKEEFAKELNISVRYVEHHFPKIQEHLKKAGKLAIKRGRGSKAAYYIMDKGDLKYEGVNKNSRVF